MSTLKRLSIDGLFAACVMLFATPTNSIAQDEAETVDPIVAEAEAFYAGYAADLLAGNREGLADRYSDAGNYFLGNGRKTFLTHEIMTSVYTSDTWNAPEEFEWVDMSFEAVGPDAVMVLGQYNWIRETRDWTFSYASMLLRKDGEWKIRFEDQSLDLEDAKGMICAEEPPAEGSEEEAPEDSDESGDSN